MLTVIDMEGMKLPIGLRNKLLNIIRGYTVLRQGTKRGAEEKLLEMSAKHAKLGNVENVTQGPTASGDGGSYSANPSGLAHIGQAADGLRLAKGMHVPVSQSYSSIPEWMQCGNRGLCGTVQEMENPSTCQ